MGLYAAGVRKLHGETRFLNGEKRDDEFVGGTFETATPSQPPKQRALDTLAQIQSLIN
jgi:hypothetical protein